MPSITVWNRLEPRPRSADMQSSLEARIADPLWMLARQWQLGEFVGHDGGTPVRVQIDANSARLDRCRLGADTSKPCAYDPRRQPLESLVEREPVRPAGSTIKSEAGLRIAAEAGLHFLRLLDAAKLAKYASKYTEAYPLPRLTESRRAATDADAVALWALLAARTPDGVRLHEDLARSPRAVGKAKIATADRAKVRRVAEAWLEWWDDLVSEPADDVDAWIDNRMEYQLAVSATFPSPGGEVVLESDAYASGRLDWHSFDRRPDATLEGAPSSRRVKQDAIPMPVAYRGMPSTRWWELEDAAVDFGRTDAGPPDLLHLLLIEFACTYGNDWYRVPLDVEVGTVTRINSLVVTDSFGEPFLVPSAAAVDGPAPEWSLFRLTGDADDAVLLAPTLAASLEDEPVEEIALVQDEVANLAWGIERVIQNLAGNRLRLAETDHRSPEPARREVPPRYRVATSVPNAWLPFVPAEPPDMGPTWVRAAVWPPDATEPETRPGRGQLLAAADLWLHGAEIPREGTLVTRSYQLARWTDGSTHLWLGRRKLSGGEAPPGGLAFDEIA